MCISPLFLSTFISDFTYSSNIVVFGLLFFRYFNLFCVLVSHRREIKIELEKLDRKNRIIVSDVSNIKKETTLNRSYEQVSGDIEMQKIKIDTE